MRRGSDAVPYGRFAAEVLAIYDFRAKKTVAKMRQVLRELVELVEDTSGITPAAIARWRKAHPSRAPATVHSLLRSLNAALQIAVSSGYLRSNPLDVKQLWPDVVRDDDEPRHHSLAEIRQVLTHLRSQSGFGWHQQRLYALTATVAYTGVRKLEALHLTIPDVDFAARCVRIVSRRARLKTRASAQPVGLPDELAAILRCWIPKTGAIWLFPGATRRSPWTGGPPGHKPLDRLKAEAQAAGVDGFTFQSLRHSWATHAEIWGLGETMIQRQLRHTSRKTQQAYRHADLANLATSVRSISFFAPVAKAVKV